MNILSLGSQGQTTQIERIHQGFLALGVHSIMEPNVVNNNISVDYSNIDVIYCNDPASYARALHIKNDTNTKFKGKLVFNVLDIPPHLLPFDKYDLSMYPKVEHTWPRNFDVNFLAQQLAQADLITTICDHVTWQVKQFCKLNAHTIYNPIMDVFPTDIPEGHLLKNRFKFLYVGRANDPNKRFYLVVQTMQLLGEPPDSLCVAGSENPGFGVYVGVVDPGVLNLLYNAVQYFWFPSAFKSIGLPALEAVVCKTIPLVCSDDPVTKEFWGPIGVAPDPYEIANVLINPGWNFFAQKFVNDHAPLYKERFSGKSIAQNIINVIEKV